MFSKSAAFHLRMGSRTASWEEWMKEWMSSSLKKSPRCIQSKDRCICWSAGACFHFWKPKFSFYSHPLFLNSSPARRLLRSSESQDGEKKKSKGGFLNLIKRSSKPDKSEKSEKNQAPPPSSGTSGTVSVASVSTSSIAEEPSSPKVPIKSPAPEPKSRYKDQHW